VEKRGDGNEGTWETENFATAADRVTVFLDMASGSVTVSGAP
jgi:hypothetical protein